MKYKIIEIPSFGDEVRKFCVVTSDDLNFSSFECDVQTPNYDAFLIQVGLTDEEVHAFPVDEWVEA